MSDVYLYKPNGLKVPDASTAKVIEAVNGMEGRSTSLNPDMGPGGGGAGFAFIQPPKNGDTDKQYAERVFRLLNIAYVKMYHQNQATITYQESLSAIPAPVHGVPDNVIEAG